MYDNSLNTLSKAVLPILFNRYKKLSLEEILKIEIVKTIENVFNFKSEDLKKKIVV